MSALKGINQDRLKVHFLKPEGEISRRELLQLVLPRYEVVPFIEPALCRGHQECGLCVDACPLKAIKVEEGEVAVDTALCGGCGACVEICPSGAIHPQGDVYVIKQEACTKCGLCEDACATDAIFEE